MCVHGSAHRKEGRHGLVKVLPSVGVGGLQLQDVSVPSLLCNGFLLPESGGELVYLCLGRVGVVVRLGESAEGVLCILTRLLVLLLALGREGGGRG